MKTTSIEGALAAWLKWGTLASTAVCLAGLAWILAAGAPVTREGLAALTPCPWPCTDVPGGALVLAGVLALLAVGAGRLVVAAVLFRRAGDRLYAAVSATGFLLVLAAAAVATLGR